MKPQNAAATRNPTPATRIYGLIARAAPIGVLFRRGPSKRVLLVYWDMERDIFYPGQWFKGRIYERRCDLSPSGKHLVYLAASQKPPYYSWTAVSHPPYLTSVVFWPNLGTWGGGGLFQTETQLSLNHDAAHLRVAKGSQIPPKLSITQLGAYSGGGEDHPILDHRLQRDGWRLLQEGTRIKQNSRAPLWVEYNPPFIWSRLEPHGKHVWELQMIIRGIGERQGDWYIIEYALFHPASRQATPLGRLDWADWCHSGDLVFAKDGCLWRLAPDRDGESGALLEQARKLVDLRPLTFREMPPPPEAREWSSVVPLPEPYRTE